MTEEILWKRAHCSRMDHGGCSLLVGVRGNRIVEIKGDPEGFLNKGYACPKGLASTERLTHPGRLLHPMKRKGERGQGVWERIPWSEALQFIAGRLNDIKKASGAKAVAFCQGMPKGLELFGLVRLANLFGSPNVVGVQDVCHAPREVSGIHTCGFYPVADLHNPCNVIILWASNPMSTNEEGQICTLLLNRIKEGPFEVGIVEADGEGHVARHGVDAEQAEQRGEVGIGAVVADEEAGVHTDGSSHPRSRLTVWVWPPR